MVTWIIMSYTYPHWYSQKGGEISMAPFEDQEDVHNKTSSPGCEKTCAKPLVSAAWVNYPSISIRVCLKMGDTPMYGYEAMGK